MESAIHKTANSCTVRTVKKRPYPRTAENYSNPERVGVSGILKEVGHLGIENINNVLCKKEAARFLKLGDDESAASLLAQSVGINIRHQASTTYHKAIGLKPKLAQKQPTDKPLLTTQKKLLQFTQGINQVKPILEKFPDDWTIVQLTTLPRPSQLNRHQKVPQTTPHMYLTHYKCGTNASAFVMKVPASTDCQYLIRDFGILLEDHADINRSPGTSKEAYWTKRLDLSNKLKRLVKAMGEKWLCENTSLMLGCLEKAKLRKFSDDMVSYFMSKLNLEPHPKRKFLLGKLIESYSHMSDEEVVRAMYKVLKLQPGERMSCTKHDSGDSDAEEEMYPGRKKQPRLDSSQPGSSKGVNRARGIEQIKPDRLLRAVKALMRQEQKLKAFKNARRRPVILILDQDVQMLPWESMQIMKIQPATRMNSLKMMEVAYEKYQSNGNGVVNPLNGYYVLDPKNDLVRTTERMGKYLHKKFNGKGIVGKAPNPSDFLEVLCTKDLMVYCGHGTGHRFTLSSSLKKVGCKAVALLMGCSSLKLETNNKGTAGHVLSYIIGCSPCVLGLLWQVTDRDTDFFTQAFLDCWLPGPLHEEDEMVYALLKTRKAALHFTNSAAIAIYGLPVRIEGKREGD